MVIGKAERPTKVQGKPYSRPSNKAVSNKEPSKGQLATGAPSAFNQGSRKGKKAWRKNIDLSVEEQALERAREEERLTGSVSSRV